MIREHSFRINLVTGPPLSGKTTYVQAHMTPGDLVIDLDYLAAALSYSAIHEDNPKNIKFAWRLMDAALVELAIGSHESNHRVWIVGCFRTLRRDTMIRFLNPARVIVIATPKDICLSRLRAEVSSRPKSILFTAIHTWWKEWDGVQNAEIITPAEDTESTIGVE